MGDQNGFLRICSLIALIGLILIYQPYLAPQIMQNALGTNSTTMNYFQLILWIVIAIAVMSILYKFSKWFIEIYNEFYRLKNFSEATFNQIRVAMKKRLDLINQLREATESYTKYERGAFEGVTAMRTAVDKAKPEEIDKIDTESQSLIGRLFAVVENYPNLKTSTLVTDLMTSIRNVENEIAKHRYEYNQITQSFNTLMDTIPTKFVGKIIGLQKLLYIDFEDEISTVPKTSYSQLGLV